jgi:hypothetical protein
MYLWWFTKILIESKITRPIFLSDYILHVFSNQVRDKY